MKERILAIAGGTTGGLWQALHVALQDSEWMIKVVVGAIVGTLISILVSEAYKTFKYFLKAFKNGTIRKTNKRNK